MEWTKEYYGVSHLLVKRPFQITMNRLGKGKRYNVYMLNLNRDVNDEVFTPVNEYTGIKNKCISIAESWAKNLGIGKEK